MAAPVAWWVGIGALGMYGYATGRFTNFIDNFKNKNDNKKTNFSNENIPSQQPHTIIVHQDPNHNNKQMSYLLPLGVACSISLGGYYYYIHSSGTKKVITKVEDTAAETQTLVQKTDDNNAQRFEILDEKNESRAQTLETEIRSEQRAGFNIISEQLYCLTQVAIQTLSALASSNNDPSVNENDNTNDNNEKLLNYCDKAQEMADTILSDEHLLTAKDNNLKDIKAEIQLRNQQQQRVIISNSNNNNITPGGPMDNNNNNNNNNNNYKYVLKRHDVMIARFCFCDSLFVCLCFFQKYIFTQNIYTNQSKKY